MLLPMDHSEWISFLDLSQNLAVSAEAQSQQIKQVDTKEAVIIKFNIEGPLETADSDYTFVGSPHWIQTPSGKLYVYANVEIDRLTSIFKIFEYSPETKKLTYISDREDFSQYFGSGINPIQIIAMAPDENRFLILLESYNSDYQIFEVQISTGKVHKLHEFKSEENSTFLVHDNSVYFSTVVDQTRTGPYNVNFQRLDLKNNSVEILYTEVTELPNKDSLHTTLSDEGKIQWSKLRKSHLNVVAEFDQKTRVFESWMRPEEKARVVVPLKIHRWLQKATNLITYSKNEPKKTPIETFSEKGSYVTFTTSRGQILSVPASTKHKQKGIFLGSPGSPDFQFIIPAIDYDFAYFIESNDGQLFLVTEFKLSKTPIYIYKINLEKNDLTLSAKLSIEVEQGTPSLFLKNNSGRTFFILYTGDGTLELYEFLSSTESFLHLDSISFRYFAPKLAHFEDIQGKIRLLGVDQFGDLKVVTPGL